LQAAFLKDVPCEIAVFAGRGVQETLRKGVPKGVQKRTLQRTRTGLFLGVRFSSFFVLFDASRAYLGALCCHLVASWPRRPTKGGPREPQEAAKGAQEPQSSQERPRASQKCSGEQKKKNKCVPGSPTRGQDRPREPSKESPRQRLNHACKEGCLGGSFPPALYKQGQGHPALRRAALFIVLFASVLLYYFLLQCRVYCCAVL
jgi:hypothetical protein